MITQKKYFLAAALVVLVAVAALAVGQTAHAEAYVTANVGSSIPLVADETDINGLSAEAEFANGYYLSGAVGYAWKLLRLETELSYRFTDLEEVSLTLPTFLLGVPVTVSTPVTGDISTFALMANAWRSFDIGAAWSPFIGGGIGFSAIELDVESVGTIGVVFNDQDVVFAYHLGAGVEYEISDKVSVNLAYRFFDTTEALFESGTTTIKTDVTNHELMAGLIIRF